jgi:acyl-CoA synthetase (NDP forming)
MTDRHTNIRRLLKPRHVAFVGGRSAEPAIEVCRASGFTGQIWAVHPKYSELAGLQVYKSVRDLPEPPDATFLYVGRDHVAGIVHDLDEMGAGGAICHAAGFGELESQGEDYADALAQAAGDLAVLGPNSNGMLNYLDRIVLWPLDDHRPRPIERGAAVITQSGGVAFNYAMNTRGVPAAYVLSTGNQAITDVGELIQVLVEDDRVTAIGLFLEGINDVPGFSAAAAQAAARGIPIVALKAGRTEIGARMALTHTGSLAGSDELYQALFDRLGIARVRSLPEFDETLKMITVAGIPAGRRLAVLTASGAVRTLSADVGTEVGLDFPEPGNAVAAELREQIPVFAVVSNPFDYNAAYAGMDVFSLENEAALRECYATMLKDDYDAAALFHMMDDNFDQSGNLIPNPGLRAWIDAVAEWGRPAAAMAMMPEEMGPAIRDHCIQHNIAPLQGLDDGIRAIGYAAQLGQALKRITAEGTDRLPLPAIPAIDGQGRLLDESASKAALAGHGLLVPRARVVSRADLAAGAAELDYPLALKVHGAEFSHKARLGGVRLGLQNHTALEAAAAAIMADLASRGLTCDAFLLEEMVPEPLAELILGVTYNPRFGHALLIGPGGVYVERFDPPTPILLPASRTFVERRIAELGSDLGLPAAAQASIYGAVAAVCDYTAANREHLLELDVNPLMVSKDGDLTTAADALIRLGR